MSQNTKHNARVVGTWVTSDPREVMNSGTDGIDMQRSGGLPGPRVEGVWAEGGQSTAGGKKMNYATVQRPLGLRAPALPLSLLSILHCVVPGFLELLEGLLAALRRRGAAVAVVQRRASESQSVGCGLCLCVCVGGEQQYESQEIAAAIRGF